MTDIIFILFLGRIRQHSVTHIIYMYDDDAIGCHGDAHLLFVVGYDPREDEILHEVIVGAARQRVETHQVLKVTDLTPLNQQYHSQLATGYQRVETIRYSKLLISLCWINSTTVSWLQATSVLRHIRYSKLLISPSWINSNTVSWLQATSVLRHIRYSKLLISPRWINSTTVSWLQATSVLRQSGTQSYWSHSAESTVPQSAGYRLPACWDTSGTQSYWSHPAESTVPQSAGYRLPACWDNQVLKVTDLTLLNQQYHSQLATGYQRVETHQVLKVTDLTPLNQQ